LKTVIDRLLHVKLLTEHLVKFSTTAYRILI